MPHDLNQQLADFAKNRKFISKGPLCVALVITEHAKKRGLPLDAEALLTEGGGQVLGLGKSAVQSILNRYGIDRVLAAEGGRTSRGSIGNMRAYVQFLNDLDDAQAVDLDGIEQFWISRVRDFFAGKPFKINIDASKSIRAVVRDVLEQAYQRQSEGTGTYYVGAVMQHMIGAKLDCVLGDGRFEHNSFSTSDAQTGRAGDFFIGDVAVHVTTAPGEAVIERCRENLGQGYKAVLVTSVKGVAVAEGLAENFGLAERIDIFEFEQFVASNLYELGAFMGEGRRTAIHDLVKRYNEIIERFETDLSMKIEFNSR